MPTPFLYYSLALKLLEIILSLLDQYMEAIGQAHGSPLPADAAKLLLLTDQARRAVRELADGTRARSIYKEEPDGKN